VLDAKIDRELDRPLQALGSETGQVQIPRLSQTKRRFEASRSRSSPASMSVITAVSSSDASSTSMIRCGSPNSEGVRTSVARISPLRSRMSGRAVPTASARMARRPP
jgi:hypothetical protein